MWKKSLNLSLLIQKLRLYKGVRAMKLKFKHQKFQADAAKAVVDVFAGQPHLSSSYIMDKGYTPYKQFEQQKLVKEDEEIYGFGNHPI